MSQQTQPQSREQLDYATEIRKPRFYKVLIHNDDYTPMDFVVEVLQEFFAKTAEEAEAIMWMVHNQGVGVAGVYPKDIAATKSAMVNQYAQQHEHPLKTSIERDERDEA